MALLEDLGLFYGSHTVRVVMNKSDSNIPMIRKLGPGPRLLRHYCFPLFMLLHLHGLKYVLMVIFTDETVRNVSYIYLSRFTWENIFKSINLAERRRVNRY